jgi:hypothetical protein
MPNSPGTQHRSVRVSDEDWGDLDTAARAEGTDRGTLIKQFIRWYLRRPGAKLPDRPERRVDRGNGGATTGPNTAINSQR